MVLRSADFPENPPPPPPPPPRTPPFCLLFFLFFFFFFFFSYRRAQPSQHWLLAVSGGMNFPFFPPPWVDVGSTDGGSSHFGRADEIAPVLNFFGEGPYSPPPRQTSPSSEWRVLSSKSDFLCSPSDPSRTIFVNKSRALGPLGQSAPLL